MSGLDEAIIEGMLGEYQAFTKSTNLVPEDHHDHIAHIFAGIAAESGEILGKYQKHLRKDTAVTEEYIASLIAETGDVLWYLSELGNAYGFTLEEAMLANYNKLTSRKSRGKLQGDGDNR